MAKEISFQSSSITFTASVTKVEREKIYGWTEVKTYDSRNKECRLVNLLDDGKTIIPAGGFSLKCLAEDGKEISRKELVAVNQQGEKLPVIPSIFDQPVSLNENKTLQDYLNMTVKAVYQLTGLDNKAEILTLLKSGKIFHFHFNYRADYDSDDAFLIPGEDEIFAVVGKIVDYQMLGLETQVVITEEEEEESDDMDFSML